jgi:hypothetical protein
MEQKTIGAVVGLATGLANWTDSTLLRLVTGLGRLTTGLVVVDELGTAAGVVTAAAHQEPAFLTGSFPSTSTSKVAGGRVRRPVRTNLAHWFADHAG